MMRGAVLLLYAAGGVILLGAGWWGHWPTAIAAIIGTVLLAIPTVLVADARLTQDADDKLTGGRAADRSFFVRELAERDATHIRTVQEMSFAAGGLDAQVRLLESKHRRMTDRPRDARGRMMREAEVDDQP